MHLQEGSMPFLLGDYLRAYSQDFRILSSSNPYRFALNGLNYSAHVSLAHFAARKNPDEWRIQIPRSVRETQIAREQAGDIVLFIGFFDDYPAFTAWEASYVLSLNSKDIGSVYVPHSNANDASTNMAALDRRAARNLGRNTTKLTFRGEFLGFYAENLNLLHQVETGAQLLRVVEQFSDFIEQAEPSGTENQLVEIAGRRRKVSSVRKNYPRNPHFRDSVMSAYSGSCAICRKQLGIVEAAHIIPHNHPDCVEAVTNGIALCVEHHRLYDAALLMPTAGQRFVLNNQRVEHLKNIGQDSGLDEVRILAAGSYEVPHDAQFNPNEEFLKRGVRIRLGTDA